MMKVKHWTHLSQCIIGLHASTIRTCIVIVLIQMLFVWEIPPPSILVYGIVRSLSVTYCRPEVALLETRPFQFDINPITLIILSKYYSGVPPSERLREIFILEYSCTFAWYSGECVQLTSFSGYHSLF